MEEYTGDLPAHVRAQIEEHTSGGYILFRIGPEGDTIIDMAFDNEVAYLALVKKATTTVSALNQIDDINTIRGFSGGFFNAEYGFGEEDEEEEEEEEDYDETEDDESDID